MTLYYFIESYKIFPFFRDRKERDVWVKVNACYYYHYYYYYNHVLLFQYLRRSSLLEIEKRRSFETIKRIQLAKLNNVNKSLLIN